MRFVFKMIVFPFWLIPALPAPLPPRPPPMPALYLPPLAMMGPLHKEGFVWEPKCIFTPWPYISPL